MILLEARNLTKTFKSLVAVSDFSFDVKDKEILGLMGPNGAGKTTVINLVSGFLRPDSGIIDWHNENISGLKPFKIARKGIARTFQQARVFPKMSVFDNVVVSVPESNRGHISSASDHRRRVLDILEFVGMEAKPSKLAGELPQNELRKLEIARAVGSDPELILLDEPVSGLTAEESDSIVDTIKRLNEAGITLIIIEHVMRMLLRVSDRLVVMDSGLKLCEGTPEEIRRDPRVVEAYFGTETEDSA
jgi:ABC-type branched-subunit amino acid transport system ATPase component